MASRVERFELTAEPNTALALRARLGLSGLGETSPDEIRHVITSAPTVSVKVNGQDAGAFLPGSSARVWREQEVTIPAQLNRTGRVLVEVSVESPREYESYHYWLLQ